MGGRGAAGGVSDKGKKYGTEYHSVMLYGNTKFVVHNEGAPNLPLETMSGDKGRKYAAVNNKRELQAIGFYGEDGKRTKQIDLLHPHGGEQPHVHFGYYHGQEGYKLTAAEKKFVDELEEAWKKGRK